MANVAVIGAQWGDEGKGKIVDWLSQRADVVVRFQGGDNAGDALVIGNVEYRVRLVPAGVVRPDKLSIIGNGGVVDPWALLKEIEAIRDKGGSVTPASLKIAENAALILPSHGQIDRAREEASGEKKIGTTGRGIGPAYEDKVGRRAIRLCDLADPASLGDKLDHLLLHHNALLRGLNAPEVERAPLLQSLLDIAPKVLPFADIVWHRLDEARRAGKRILFEGAQGVMLDVDHGTYPYVTSSNTHPGRRLAGMRVRRGDVGICPVIDVEHDALRALEQDALAGAARLVEAVPDDVGERQHLGRDVQQRLQQRRALHLGRIEAAQQGIVMQQQMVELVAEAGGVGEVAQAYGAAPDLVLIGRADAAAGGADLLLAARLLACAVDLSVRGQDQRRVLGDLEAVRRDDDALVADGVDLPEQGPGIDDDDVADDRQLVRAHHARGQQAQPVLDIADDQRMSGIVAALEAHHYVGALRQPIDDLAFPLVAPLGADHRDIRHVRTNPCRNRPRSGERDDLLTFEAMPATEPPRLGHGIVDRDQARHGHPAIAAQPLRQRRLRAGSH